MAAARREDGEGSGAATALVRGEGGGGAIVARALAVTHTHVVDVGPHESKVQNRQRLIELLVSVTVTTRH